MNRSFVKWLVFVLLCCVVPVLFYGFVIGGFVSPLVIMVWLFRHLATGFGALYAIHLLVYLPVLYRVASFLSKKMVNSRFGASALALFCGAAVLVSFLPMYGVAHSVTRTYNLYQMLVRP
ncbi:hypothetical protein [Ramlibacter sp.]|uniref:hypothetical protein n=1 Tax=Ramlibacter sp. TaxID=1917967 RepID=UPI00261E8138|nr:hypothetical protein [Ramlibacter sp.]